MHVTDLETVEDQYTIGACYRLRETVEDQYTIGACYKLREETVEDQYIGACYKLGETVVGQYPLGACGFIEDCAWDPNCVKTSAGECQGEQTGQPDIFSFTLHLQLTFFSSTPHSQPQPLVCIPCQMPTLFTHLPYPNIAVLVAWA